MISKGNYSLLRSSPYWLRLSVETWNTLYLAAALLPHSWQDRLEQAQHTEHIRVKLGPCLLQAILFERPSLRISSIVDEQIGAPGSLQDGLDAGLRTHVEGKYVVGASRVRRGSATGAKHKEALGG